MIKQSDTNTIEGPAPKAPEHQLKYGERPRADRKDFNFIRYEQNHHHQVHIFQPNG